MNLRFVWIPLAILAGYAQTPAPYVVNADKGWFVGGRPLSRNVPVPEGAALTAKEPGELVLQCPASKLYSYTCRLNPCEVQACRTQRAAGLDVKEVALPSIGLGFLKWDRFLSREPRAPVFAVAREGGNPNDAVLRQDAKGVHFGAALSRVLEGRYCLRLGGLPAENSAAPLMATLDWDRALDAEGVAFVPGLRPGLYAMQVGTPGLGAACRVDAAQVPAWVVIAVETSYANVNRDWGDVLSRLNDLDRAGSSQSLIATLRHAALATLADSNGNQ